MADQPTLPDAIGPSEEVNLEPQADSKSILVNPVVDQSDSRSSSLSDYDDRYDGSELGHPIPEKVSVNGDIDSEAETERLDLTPRHKLQDTEDLPRVEHEKMVSPSRIQYEHIEISKGEDAESSPISDPHTSPVARYVFPGSVGSITPSDRGSKSPIAVAGKKRKREGSSERSSGGESNIDRMVQNKANEAPDLPALDAENLVDEALDEDILSEIDTINDIDEHNDERLKDSEMVLHGLRPEPSETVPKKYGKSKNKRINKQSIEAEQNEEAQDLDDLTATAEHQLEAEDDSPEGEGETEVNSAAKNEEGTSHLSQTLLVSGTAFVRAVSNVDPPIVQRSRGAMDILTTLERSFAGMRGQILDGQINGIDRELEAVQDPNPQDPKYLKIMQSIDARYDGLIEHEDKLLGYKLKTLEAQTIAERSQIHGQYYQTIREERDKALEALNSEFFRIQRERRQAQEGLEHTNLYNPDRQLQIQRQTKVNLELSILGGVKKHIGMPGPELPGLKESEIDEDLRAMKLLGPASKIAERLNEPLPSEQRTAEEQFLQQTPWANPQHPLTQQSVMSSQGSRQMNPFTTPAPQRQLFNSHLPNGSGSTIAAPSEPSSSAIAAGPNNHGPAIIDSGSRDAPAMSNPFEGSADSPLNYTKLNHGSGRVVPVEGSESGRERAAAASRWSPTASFKEKTNGPKVDRSSTPKDHRLNNEGLGLQMPGGVKAEEENPGARFAYGTSPAHAPEKTHPLGIAAGGVFGR
ncbi:MAG: hypothetical protein M1820_010484 [Bogoriella megaspora]|nr:MAG: hypothetical protein M1820_010484 [Bogoriella megaspora]